MPLTQFLIVEAIACMPAAVFLAFPSGRRLLAEMRRLYVIAPLRLITGRRRPNYWHIRHLERELLGRPAHATRLDELRCGQCRRLTGISTIAR